MNQQISAECLPIGSSAADRLRISGLPATAIGKRADIEIKLEVETRRSRGVNADKSLHKQTLVLTQTSFELPLPASVRSAYCYESPALRVAIKLHLKIDDGILFDTKLVTEIARPLPRPPAPSVDAAKLIEPADKFDFSANLKAIPPHNRLIVLALSALAVVLIGVNSLLGVHDQFTANTAVYWYDHSGSDGDSESPMLKSLIGSGGLGLAVWFAIRRQFRRYMQIQLRPGVKFPRRGQRLLARDLIHGSARVPLEKATLRVVAVNDEKGQYKDGSGTKERTVSFTTPVRGVLIYEQFLPYLPARTPVETYLEGELDFALVFDQLYPPVKPCNSHGIDLRWEVQLLHPLFVDQELGCTTDGLVFDDFQPPP